MTSRSDNPIFAIDTNVIDAFMNITKAYLAGAERLTALNLNTARQAVEDSARAGETILAMGQGELAADSPATLGRQLEKALAYTRTCSDILAQTQDEMIESWLRYLAEQPRLFATPPGWMSPTALLTQMLEQMGSLAATKPAATVHARGHAAPPAVAAAATKKAA